MAGPGRSRTTGLTSRAPTLWQRAASRPRRAREWPGAVATVLLCTGPAILPPLATLDLAVGLACRTLDRTACLALFLRPPE